MVRPRGVTFLELITLAVLLFILAAFGVPMISPTAQQLRLKGAAWQLVGDLRLLRQRAVATHKRFRVCIDKCKVAVPEGAYGVEVEQLPVGSLKWGSETGAPVMLPPNVTISTNATATFSPSGMAGAATFTVSNLMGSYKVTVGSTGQVTAAMCTGSKCP